MTGLEELSARREQRCIQFSKKCLKHETNKRLFLLNEQNEGPDIRRREKYKVNFAYTSTYKNSAVPYCQRALNKLEEEERRRAEERKEERRRAEEREEEVEEEEVG